MLADLCFFEGLDEAGQTELVDATLAEVDSNADNCLNFSEFTTCYNKLKSKTEEQEAAGVKLPSIFGEVRALHVVATLLTPTYSSSDWLECVSTNEKAERCACQPMRRLVPLNLHRYGY